MFPLLTSMYQTVTDEGIGLSWESQHKRVKIVPGRNWRKLHCTTPFSTWWTPHWAEEKQTSNLADPDFQVPANREKKCGSKHKRGIFTNTRQFPTREGNSPSSLPCEPCNYVSKKMELCLQIQQITKNKFKKATNRQLAIHIGSVTTPNGWFRHRSQLECKSVTTTHWHTVQKKILTTLWTKKRGDVLWLNAPPANQEFRTCTMPRVGVWMAFWLDGWWEDPAMLPAWRRGAPSVCCKMHKNVNVHLTQCCRFWPGTCIYNHRRLA